MQLHFSLHKALHFEDTISHEATEISLTCLTSLNYSNNLLVFPKEENITYTSQEPQNDLIKCLFEEFRKEVLRRIDNSQYFAVTNDETSNVSRMEQSAVSVRLINK